MDIVCKWMYAIARFGWPPPWDKTAQVFAEMRQMGYTFTELEALGEANLTELISRKQDLKTWLADSGMKLATFAVILPETVSTDRHRRKKAQDYFRRGVETAAELKSPSVYMDAYTFDSAVFGGDQEKGKLSYGKQVAAYLPGDNFAWPTFWDHYVDSIFQCNEICKSFGVKLLVEPRIGEIVSNSDGALALAKGIHDDNFGLIFDTAHLYAQKENLALSVAKLHRYIEYIDISDNDGRENRHLVPGQGRIEWDTFFTCLKHYEVDVPLASDLEKLPDVPGSFRATRDFLGNAIRRLAS